jgi:hypothetical protein
VAVGEVGVEGEVEAVEEEEGVREEAEEEEEATAMEGLRGLLLVEAISSTASI